MIATVATLTAVFELARRGQEIIRKFNAADNDEARLEIAGDAIAFVKSARVRLQDEFDGPAITVEAAREAIANIAQGMADYETAFDNTPGKETT